MQSFKQHAGGVQARSPDWLLCGVIGTDTCAPANFEEAASQLLQRLMATMAESARHQEACIALQAVAASASRMPEAWLAHGQQVLTVP